MGSECFIGLVTGLKNLTPPLSVAPLSHVHQKEVWEPVFVEDVLHITTQYLAAIIILIEGILHIYSADSSSAL